MDRYVSLVLSVSRWASCCSRELVLSCRWSEGHGSPQARAAAGDRGCGHGVPTLRCRAHTGRRAGTGPGQRCPCVQRAPDVDGHRFELRVGTIVHDRPQRGWVLDLEDQDPTIRERAAQLVRRQLRHDQDGRGGESRHDRCHLEQPGDLSTERPQWLHCTGRHDSGAGHDVLDRDQRRQYLGADRCQHQLRRRGLGVVGGPRCLDDRRWIEMANSRHHGMERQQRFQGDKGQG